MLQAMEKLSSTRIDLPEEVLIEILALLPAKSLIRFTSVCKSWFSLIKSPQFVTKHFASTINSLQINNFDCQSLVSFSSNANSFNPIVRFLSYETLEISANFECKPIVDSYDSEIPVVWKLHGPCNGIFCVEVFKIRTILLLWNPATREFFTPKLPRRMLPFLGFGFDDNSNDYKIVMVDSSGYAELYSLRSNSWKTIEPVRMFDRIKNAKEMFDVIDEISKGRMFTWLIFDTSSHGFSLLSFDIIDEVFIETPMPEGVKGCYYCFMHQRSKELFPSLICLDLINCEFRAASADIWVLNEYGPGGRWTKERSFVWPECMRVGPPKGLWKNEGILFVGRRGPLTMYNTITQEMKTVYVPGHHLLGYTESLFSIKDVCQSGELEDSSPREAFEQTLEPGGSNGDAEDVANRICDDILYCICEVNQPALSNSVTF